MLNPSSGIMLQLISCLQSRRCPHFMLDNVDLFHSCDPDQLDKLAKQVWALVRCLVTGYTQDL